VLSLQCHDVDYTIERVLTLRPGATTMALTTPPNLAKLAAHKQLRLDELLDRNAEGAITQGERSELESLVLEAESLMTANARLVADFASRQAIAPPSGAVPVTVWVTPQPTER
jgi:hypothetical protein